MFRSLLSRSFFGPRQVASSGIWGPTQARCVSFDWSKSEVDLTLEQPIESLYKPKTGLVYIFNHTKLTAFSTKQARKASHSLSPKQMPGNRKHLARTVDDNIYLLTSHGLEPSQISLSKLSGEFEPQVLCEAPPFATRVMTAVGNTLVLIGTRAFVESEGEGVEVATYNTTAGDGWKVTPVQPHSPRASLRMGVVAADDRRVLFFTPTEDNIMYEVSEFNTYTNTWSPVPAEFEDGDAIPVPANDSTFTRVGKYVVIFGGLRVTNQSSFYIFDTEQRKWLNSASRLSGLTPPALSAHSAVAISDSEFYVVGGHGNFTSSSDVYNVRLSE